MKPKAGTFSQFKQEKKKRHKLPKSRMEDETSMQII